ncbi:MAG TPA: enoyl-CoA hydratase/isomerase family protein, partial [Rubrivivax sp.]|nr:enoyl-CoA hydratase/isomerase family protein [Rubrivivax sp.]
MSTNMSEPQTLHLKRDGAVLHVTLNRPETRNAMSLAMVLELREALAAAEADGGTRVIVLRGAGGHFCAGADLRDMAGARMKLAEDPEALVKINEAFGDLCVAYANTGLATVAVLEGTVMGGGLGLACVVDVALAGSGAVFRLPETSLGVVPAQIAPFLVERLGYAEATRLAVTGGRLNSQAALTLRLVHAVHAAGALDHALAAVLSE